MKIAYFDCSSGISGDMTLGALAGLGYDVKKELKKLNLKNFRIEVKKVRKNGLAAVKVNVILLKGKKHHYGGLKNVLKVIERSRFSAEIKKESAEAFRKLAKAEAKVHGIPVSRTHFHELGDTDTIVDVVGAIAGIHALGIKKVYMSAVNAGSGSVKCAHGILPVPSPAAAELLKGIPVYTDDSGKERTTPTGALLASCVSDGFGEMPVMNISGTGCGAGYAETVRPNILRVFLGEADIPPGGESDYADVIEANIDDINPEYYDFIIQKLLDRGALDVFITNIQMKKNRPGVKLTVISVPSKTRGLTDIVFRETTTFGVRIYRTVREKLAVEKKNVRTKYGMVSVKIGRLDGEVRTASPEYEDCRKIAARRGIPLKVIYEEARKKVN